MVTARKQKIIHLINRFDIGGLEKIMADTINTLDDFIHVIVTVTDANDKSKKLLKNQVEIIELHKRDGNDFKLWSKFFALLKDLKPDVLHSYNLPTLEFQLIGFLCRVPIRIHAEHGRYASDPLGKNRKYRLYRRIINPLIHYWIPVSMDLKIWLEEYISIPQSKVQLIYNGIDTSFFQPEKPGPKLHRLEGFASSSDIVLGTIGRLDPVKNQKLLINALEYIVESRPGLKNNLKLAIVGSGPLKEQLYQQIKSLEFDNLVWIPGSRQDIKALLESFDIFILPSIAEGIPITILEAMSMSKPVVASNVGGIPEIIKPGKGILVDSNNIQLLGDAILSQLDNMETSKQMGEDARQHIQQNFSLKAMTENYRNLYMGIPCAE